MFSLQKSAACIWLLGWQLSALSVSAAVDCQCPGKAYRVIHQSVPVYEKPSASAVVTRRASAGAEVCVVGERAGYAIVIEPECDSTEKAAGDQVALATQYIRQTDIEPTEAEKSFFTWLKGMYHYIRSGGVIEGPVFRNREVQKMIEKEGRSAPVKPGGAWQ